MENVEGVKVGQRIKTEFGYTMERVEGYVGGKYEAFVEVSIKKGKEVIGKRKTALLGAFEVIK
jgi:hypothetical protein